MGADGGFTKEPSKGGFMKVSGLHEGGFEGRLREGGLRRLRKRGFEAEGDLITIVVVLKFSLAQWF